MKSKKLLLAGSHAATTAASVVDEINRQGLDWELSFIGKKWSGEDKKSKTLEYKIFQARKVKFYAVDSGKIENKFTRHTIKALFKIPFGFIHTSYLVWKIKPNLILSFGGAVGFQVAFWGWTFKVPVIIHEQTSTAGRANIKSAKFAKNIAISRETSKRYFPEGKTFLTGDPISEDILKLVGRKAKGQAKTIFITGGSRGSEWINKAFAPLTEKLSKDYQIIWQCGEKHFEQYKTNKQKYRLYGQVSPEKYAELLNQADIVVGRAGSNTVSELVVTRIPCILIPIPWSYMDEQSENAKYIQKLGLARVIKQSELTSEKLLQEIEKLIKDYPKIVKRSADIISPDLNASKNVVDLLRENM